MARSLTVTHEEHARTSPLFTGFLLLAVAWMLASAFGSDASAESAGAAARTEPAEAFAQ